MGREKSPNEDKHSGGDLSVFFFYVPLAGTSCSDGDVRHAWLRPCQMSKQYSYIRNTVDMRSEHFANKIIFNEKYVRLWSLKIWGLLFWKNWSSTYFSSNGYYILSNKSHEISVSFLYGEDQLFSGKYHSSAHWLKLQDSILAQGEVIKCSNEWIYKLIKT